jgi:DNA-binding Lrp family transcriptional regulator
MDKTDVKLMAVLENGIALTKEPFHQVAVQMGITQEEVICRLTRLKKEGIIRKFGASIRPSHIGLLANALVAWKIDQSKVREIAEYFSKMPEISHCYERKPVQEKWEYNLYTVMHSQEQESIKGKVKELANEVNVPEYKILFSTRDLKKAGMILDSIGKRTHI